MNIIINNISYTLSQDEVKFFYGISCSGKTRLLNQVRAGLTNTTLVTFDVNNPAILVESVIQLEQIQSNFIHEHTELFRGLDQNFYSFFIQNGQVMAIVNEVVTLPQNVSYVFKKLYYLFFYVEILKANTSTFQKILVIDDLGEMLDTLTFSTAFEKLLYRCKLYNIQLYVSSRRKSELDSMNTILRRVNMALPSSYSDVSIGFYQVLPDSLLYFDLPTLPDLINVAI